MGDSFADFENVRTIPVGGLNERIVPESIPINDYHKLIGLRQDRLGELIRYPGESKLDIENLGSAVLGLFPFGDYLIIQTASALIRARMNEIFSEFPQLAPELLPDNYAPPGPPPPAINPELMSYALINYQLPSGTAPAATAVGSNAVPFNTEVSDSDNRVSVAAGIITITAGAYPAFVRIDGMVCVTSPANIANSANSNQRCQLNLRNNSTNAVVANGMNMRELTANGTNEPRQVLPVTIKGRFQIAAATDFRLDCHCSQATSFGREINTGQPEVYAQIEILIEE